MAIERSILEIPEPPTTRSRDTIVPRSLILLSGMVRPTPFSSAIGRSVLGLPVDSGRTLLDRWTAEAAAVARAGSTDSLEVRVLADQSAPLPDPLESTGVDVRIERDPFDLRGTGGVLRDICAEYEDHEFLLVAGGAQLPVRPLPRLLEELRTHGADVVLVTHDDGTPVSLMLIRCECLRLVPPIGFSDMKEQVLPLIAGKYRVIVRSYAGRVAMPVRTCAQYIEALRWYHGRDPAASAANPFAEEWETRFGIVETGATVDPDVVVHDSVVLRGAKVLRGAAVVRSVICGGGTVGRDGIIVDGLVGPAGLRKGST